MWPARLSGPAGRPSALKPAMCAQRCGIPWVLVGPRLLTGQIGGARGPDCVGGLGYCSPALMRTLAMGPTRKWDHDAAGEVYK